MPNFQRLKTRSNSAFRLIYHLVLVTKFRRKSLSAEILDLSQFYWGTKSQFWSGSYAIISVGTQAPLAKLIEYVQNQEKPL